MASTKLATTKSVAISVLLMVVAGFAPAIVMGALGWKSAVSLAMLGGLATFLAGTMGRGWHTGLVIAVPFSTTAGLVVWAAPVPIVAAIALGIVAFLRGYGAKVGLQNALIMCVIALGFIVATPPTFNTSVPTPILAGIIMLVTTLWVTLVMFTARRWVHPPKLAPIETTRVLWFSSILAIMVGLATWLIVELKLGHGGGWIILTIVVVYQPDLGDGFKKVGGRILGTLVGFLLAVIVGLVVSNGPVLYLLGTICLVIAMNAMATGKPYWLFTAFMTPAIVLYDSAGSTVSKVALERLEATLVGLGIVLIFMLALVLLVNRFPSTTRANPGTYV
ncbi:MAG: FUSC family protein [Actinomycetales bacterium]